VENLKLSTGRGRFSKRAIHTRNLCESLGLKNLETEPQLEVVRNPFSKNAYIAILLRNGLAVFEEIPNEITESDDDRVDLSIFWSQVRKRLARRLDRIEKISA
jgi:hypothetical protein